MPILNEKVLQKREDERFDTGVFTRIKNSLKVGEQILLSDSENKEGVFAEITYVGKRFCTVKFQQGHSVAVNYTSMIDKNNKDEYSTVIEVKEL